MTQFHLLSFEGPDPYARAGGLATRVDGLARALVSLGFETHLWFVGNPDRPGHEEREGVQLHRWCQWLSRRHPHGVYDGEEAKHRDYTASLAPHLLEHVLLPYLAAGGDSVVLAEEWQTAAAVIELDRLLRRAGYRERVTLLWNANNLFGFHHIAWSELARAAAITTVSRIMRLRMESTGEDYTLPGRNELVLQTEDPHELVAVLERLRAYPEEERTLRATARRTAKTFAWREVVTRLLLPRVALLRSPRTVHARSIA